MHHIFRARSYLNWLLRASVNHWRMNESSATSAGCAASASLSPAVKVYRCGSELGPALNLPRPHITNPSRSRYLRLRSLSVCLVIDRRCAPDLINGLSLDPCQTRPRLRLKSYSDLSQNSFIASRGNRLRLAGPDSDGLV